MNIRLKTETKSALIVLAIVIYITCLVGLMLHRSSNRKKDIGQDDRTLRQWYISYNDTLFQNELPADVDVEWADLSAYRAMGMTFNDGKHYKIDIDDKYNPAETTRNETLIHEMCHIEVSYVEGDEIDDHGPKWQGCMLRIAEHHGFDQIW